MPIRGYAVQAFRVGNTSADAGPGSQGGAVSPRVPLSLNETAYNFGNVSLKARRPALLLAVTWGAGRVRDDACVRVWRAGLQERSNVLRHCTIGMCWCLPADNTIPLVSGVHAGRENAASAVTVPQDKSKTAALRPAALDLAQKTYTKKDHMQVGATYFVRVYAMNAAGLESALDSPPITVAAPADGLSPGVVVAIVCACMVGAATVAGVTAYWLSRTRCGPTPPPRWQPAAALLAVACTGGKPKSIMQGGCAAGFCYK